MQLHELSDHIQDICHEGHSLSSVHFTVGKDEYRLKSVDVTPTSVTFNLQLIEKEAEHTGFLTL